MKAAFILPYFGKFPDLFPFYLQSCGKNPDITWLIFSDNTKPEGCPDNVQFIQIGFQELRNKIQSLYDFPLALDIPYRFCDFKPAYGEIFAEYLSGYDYWGYCDCDLLWGNIQKIIQRYIGKYDQIGFWGHCTLYRNEKRLTTLYRHGDAYKVVFSSNYSLFFDELAFQKLLRKNKFNLAPAFELGDFYPRHFTFESVAPCGPEADYNRNQIFTWEKDGTLLRHYLQNGTLACNEIYYIHFLKRRMEIDSAIDFGKKLLIVPNRITTSEAKITSSFVRERTKKRFYKDYWKYGMTPKQIYRKLVQRFSFKRKVLLKKIMALVESSTVVC